MGTITIHWWFLGFLLVLFAMLGAVTYAYADRAETQEIYLSHIKILLECILREIKKDKE